MSLMKSGNHPIRTFFYALTVILLFSPAAFAASVTLAWDKPGGKSVAGYNIYYGLPGTNYKVSPVKVIKSANQKQIVIPNLEPGKEYLFSATSIDGSGSESDYSREISYKVPDPSNKDNSSKKQSGSPSNHTPVDPKKLPPQKPVLLGPENHKEFASGKKIRLETDVYSHPAGNVHAKSRWQIRRVDQKKPLYDVTSELDLAYHEAEASLESGLKYAWRVGVQDAESGLLSWSDEKYFIVGEKTEKDKALDIAPGQSRNEFKMISFVQWTPDSCPKKAFSPSMETDYSFGDYRIAVYDPELNGEGGYREYADFEVVPGKAYWVLARTGMDLSVEGVPVTTASDVFIPLEYNASAKNGWSMIAVPNDAVYYWGNVEIVVHDENGDILYGPMPIRQLSEDNPYMDKRIWEWENNGTDSYTAHESSSFQLEPYGGYWVKARAENVSLSFAYDMQVSLSNPKIMAAGWLHAGIDWIGDKLAPSTVFADSQSSGGSEAPPMPLDGFNKNSQDGDDQGDSTNFDRKDAGCFIDSIFKNAK